MARKLAIAGLVMALYVAMTVALQPISYGPIQVRFSTGLYVLAYYQPYLVLPLAMANSLANYFGGLGIVDIIGGFFAGLLTSYAASRVKRDYLAPLPVAIVVPVVVSSYLFVLFKLPFWVTLGYIFVGQLVAACTVGLLVVKIGRRLFPETVSGKDQPSITQR